MIVQRMYKTTINVEHPCRFISNEGNIKARLEETFNGKCYYGAFVLNVASVDRTSMCRIITSNHMAQGAVNICFTASVLTYRKGDIIPDVVIEIKNGQVIGRSQYATVTIEKSANTKTLVNGQTIPVIVEDKVIYNTNSTSINVLGSVFVGIPNPQYFHISGTIDAKVYNTVSFLIDKIKEQAERLKTAESKHFTTLLSKKKVTGGEIKTIEGNINILEMLNKAKNNPIELEAFWQKDLSKAGDLIFNAYTKVPTEDYVNLTMTLGIQEMLSDCYAIREGIIAMGEFYTKEKMDQAANIWTMITK